jgi:hypothetical protein
MDSACHVIKRILNPHFLSPTASASYDVASTIHESLVGDPSEPTADPTAAAAAADPAATTTGTHDRNRAKAELAVEVSGIISLSDITRFLMRWDHIEHCLTPCSVSDLGRAVQVDPRLTPG